jgi:bud site selection protein 31
MGNGIRRRAELKPPDGWEQFKATILSLNDEMRAAESRNADARSPQEQLWHVMQCNWKRSRAIFELRWREKTLNNTLYEWILNQGYGDRELINAWRRPGYDRLCCVRCISKNTDHGGVCICRVPRAGRPGRMGKCIHCGCPGCCSGDFSEGSDSGDEPDAPRKTT